MRNQLIYAAVFALVVVLIIWLAMRPGPEEMPRAATAGREVRLLEEAKAEPADAGTGAVAVTNERQASEWLPASNLVVRARVEGPWVANELIIRLAPHASERVVSEALSGKGFVILRRAGPLGLMRVKVPEGRTLEEAEAMVREMEGISGTERNLRTELPKDVGELPLLDTGMPLTPVGEHGREMLGLDNPAAEAHYGRNCIVALLDTGIDATHPDLMHCVLGGYNFVDDNGDTRDLHGHGTACAGIIAGNGLGAQSVKGIAPRAYVMAVKVMDASGRGTAFDVVEGLLYAVERGARVINLSMSAQGESEAVREAIAYAWQRGAVVVAAAGNEGRDEVAFPGSVGEVISVGAVDGLLQRAPFSNYGGKLTVVAPGVAVLTTAREKGYMEFSGTSAAAPFIAGALAALIGDRSGITAEEAYRAVTQAADNLGRGGRDAEFGYGIVNVRRLLADPRDRIYDVAMTTIYFDPPTLRLGTEAQVYFVIQNRGTRLIRNARVVTRVGGSRVEHTLGDLQPSQCVEVQRSLKLPESFGGQPVRVEGMVMLQEIDVAPYNNGRAVTLHPSVWRE